MQHPADTCFSRQMEFSIVGACVAGGCGVLEFIANRSSSIGQPDPRAPWLKSLRTKCTL